MVGEEVDWSEVGGEKEEDWEGNYKQHAINSLYLLSIRLNEHMMKSKAESLQSAL